MARSAQATGGSRASSTLAESIHSSMAEIPSSRTRPPQLRSKLAQDNGLAAAVAALEAIL